MNFGAITESGSNNTNPCKASKTEKNLSLSIGRHLLQRRLVGRCLQDCMPHNTSGSAIRIFRGPIRRISTKLEMYDLYKLELQNSLKDLDGKLYIDWGPGTRAWTQRAAKQDKPVIEIRSAFKEDSFPGFVNFMKSLSEIPVTAPDMGRTVAQCERNLSAFVSEDEAAVCRLGQWRKWILGPMARLC